MRNEDVYKYFWGGVMWNWMVEIVLVVVCFDM